MAGHNLPEKAWKNGAIIPYQDARIGSLNHTFQYGTGVFEGIRYYFNDESKNLFGFRVEEHYERMLRNASSILRLQIPFKAEQLVFATNELIRHLAYRENLYVRPNIYIDSEVIGVYPGPNPPVSILIHAIPFGSYIPNAHMGITLRTATWRRVDDTMIPPSGKISGVYVNSVLAADEARRAGADEALLLTHEGNVSEGSGENIFIVRYQYEGRPLVSRKLMTPPRTANILPGITRDAVMTIAKILYGERIAVTEEDLTRSDILRADECFLTGTACEIAPVLSLDDRAISAGVRDTTRSIQEAFWAITHADAPKHKNSEIAQKLAELQKHWLTPVF